MAGKPTPMLLRCPECRERHIDEGEFAEKPHHTVEKKRCRGCRQELPFSSFYFDSRTGKPRPRCKKCMGKESKAWREANPDKHKRIYRKTNHRINLKRRFGISVDTFDALEAEHGHACNICGEQESRDRRLCLDHCHATGELRGFLCSRCNLIIGGAKDDPDLLTKAAAFLRNPPIGKLPGSFES